MKLKKKLSNGFFKLILKFYELIALYGESYLRAAASLIILIIGFFLLRLGLKYSDEYFQIKESFDILLISISASFQLHFQSDWITLFQRLISIPILGTLFISLRRKFERKIRH